MSVNLKPVAEMVWVLVLIHVEQTVSLVFLVSQVVQGLREIVVLGYRVVATTYVARAALYVVMELLMQENTAVIVLRMLLVDLGLVVLAATVLL